MYWDWFFAFHLIPLGGLGIICSVTDFRENKIYNKFILWGLIYAVFLFGGLFFYNYFFKYSARNLDYLAKVLINGGIAFLVGYILWYFRLWTAGDAKLFTLYSLLIPLDFYSGAYVPFFPSFSLLVNLFFPLLVVLFVVSTLSSILEIKKLKYDGFNFDFWKITKEVGKIASAYGYMLFVVSIFHISLKGFISLFGINQALLVRFLFLVIVFVFMNKLRQLRDKTEWVDLVVYFGIIGVLTYLFLGGRIRVLLNLLKLSFLLFVLRVGIKKLMKNYLKKKEVVYREIKNLSKGDALSEHARKLIRKKTENLPEKKKERIEEISYSRLTAEDLEFINKIFKDNSKLKIGIYTTFPFAPLLFVSAFITILWRSSFVVLIGDLFGF